MPDRNSRLLRMAAARADFLEYGHQGAAGVPDVLAASWVRSQRAGVDITRPPTDFRDDIDTRSRLVRCAEPVLDQLGNDTTDLPLVIALTDSQARLVQRRDSSSAVGRLLDRVDFAPGYNYAEAKKGTNGVGTVLEAGQAVSVVGPEHFTEELQAFACTGAPVFDPLTGRIEGILDISTLADAWSPLVHTLVKSAAKDIARNLLLDRNQAQQALFETYLRADARSTRQAVFAFANSVFMANAAAQAMFDPVEQLAVREHATFLMARRDRVSETMAFSSGRIIRIRGTRIVSGSDTAGIVVIAEAVTGEASQPRPPAPGPEFDDRVLPRVATAGAATRGLVGDLRRPHVPIASGSSPAWIRACSELRDALAAKAPTIVLGETGTGKFTLLAELFHADHPCGRSVAVDASQLHSGAETDLDALLGSTREQTLCIVRNIDQASTDGVERIDKLFTTLGSTTAPVTFAATVSDSSLDSDLPFHSLLGHFEVAVTIPPLRCRTEDLTLIVSRVLEEIAPGRRVRLSPAAARTVAQYTWPRNVSQLREALTHALRTRPVGEIQDQDLPNYCQTRSHKILTRIEAAERDAIIAALRDKGGNRVAAATHLGMSRSSLYRKLRSYGISA
ncbi:Fis family transcriptional regulator [Streptomyces hygroscopicus subsp. hygroscopicus]|uniref:sigma-54-dependent Fis family transcriptional regulator n=1 Tax=Streptomyces sp. KHY 26 TaxID=3097359 RepID=UPI0024A24737|nr:helix-turn-helix domain-containing protein [Streptomyces hygroscopicus]GLX49470.1 Fis family transcriptional regulator [Streptomyces hygroscopicus subsp. hygroscopicus]